MSSDHDAYVHEALKLNRLELPQETETAVASQFAVLTQMYATLAQEPIPDSEESAHVFRL